MKEGHGVDTRQLCAWTEEVQVQIHAESKYTSSSIYDLCDLRPAALTTTTKIIN
jgi:hypothetical protein